MTANRSNIGSGEIAKEAALFATAIDQRVTPRWPGLERTRLASSVVKDSGQITQVQGPHVSVVGIPTEERYAPQAPDDATLATRIGEGDAEALAMLFDRYSRVVFSFAMRMLGEPGSAEELTQEVFIRIWRQGAQYQHSRGAFLTWILSITHNMAIDEIRRRKRRPQLQEPDEENLLLNSIVDLRADVEGQAWLGSLRDIVRSALQEIPESQRAAIELAYFGGLTQREIAERLGEPLGTIKTRMRLGMLKLRDRLGPLVEEQSDGPLRLLSNDGFDD